MSKNSTLPLSVVIPIYNEAKSLPILIEEYKKFLKKYQFELVCVNNGSTDGTAKVLTQYAAKKDYSFITIFTITKNIGYGHGIMSGVRKARGEVISWTHADMQTSPKDVFAAFDLYQKKRYTKIIIKGKRLGRPVVDTFVSSLMGFMATVILRVPLSEINAQPKLFHTSFRKKLTNPPDDFLLDLYFMWIVRKYDYTVISIPVQFYTRTFGVSKWAYSFRSRLRMITRTISYMLSLR